MNKTISSVIIAALAAAVPVSEQVADARSTDTGKITETVEQQWNVKKVAFLGDSITDKEHIGTDKNYWQFLEEMLGIEALVYGINGHQWSDLPGQAEKLKEEAGDQVDAIIVFAGTNDYYADVPLGEWYSYEPQKTTVSGPETDTRMRRVFQMDGSCFRGRINMVMNYLKTEFPDRQIILLTPIHRGYARFGDGNIQPEESFPNTLGLYIDDYVQAIKEAANVWAVPVIDLNSISGLFPLNKSHERYFNDKETDLLHPNSEGHYRMAKALACQLLHFPADFRQ